MGEGAPVGYPTVPRVGLGWNRGRDGARWVLGARVPGSAKVGHWNWRGLGVLMAGYRLGFEPARLEHGNPAIGEWVGRAKGWRRH